MREPVSNPDELPRRVQRSRAKGWRMPENTVAVTRPGPFGNPFVVWQDETALGARVWHVSMRSCHWPQPNKAAAVSEAVRRFRAWAEDWRASDPRTFWQHMGQIRGRNLACWCRLDQPCHADVLLELANAPLRCEAADG